MLFSICFNVSLSSIFRSPDNGFPSQCLDFITFYATWSEPVDGQSLRSPSFLSLQSRSRSDSRSDDCTSEDADPDESDPTDEPIEYPGTELFEFAQKQPIFNVDGADNDPSHYNFIQIAFYRYLTSLVHFCSTSYHYSISGTCSRSWVSRFQFQ
jgi:hypothetical protein